MTIYNSNLTPTFLSAGLSPIGPVSWKNKLNRLTGRVVVDFTEGFERSDDGGWTFIASFDDGGYAVIFQADGPNEVNGEFPWFDINFHKSEKEAMDDLFEKLLEEENEIYQRRFYNFINEGKKDDAVKFRADHKTFHELRMQLLAGRPLEVAQIQATLVGMASRTEPL